MALFGTFADVSFPDVIFLIGNGSGNLTVRQQNYELPEEYVLSMENGHITQMSFNGQRIDSSEQAHSFITELIRNGSGEFEFHRCPVAKGSLSIQTTEAVLSSISMLDEMTGLRDHFPDPYTVFLENKHVSTSLDPELQKLWPPIEPYFREGICAAELSEKVGLFLDQILLKIYKLRLAEVIIPKRAYYKTEPLPLLELNHAEEFLDSEMKALAMKLKPIWNRPATVPLPKRREETAPANCICEESDRPDFSSVQIFRPDKNTTDKFMRSLKKLMRAS